MSPTLLFAAVLVATAAGLLLWHLRDWREAQAAALADHELAYQRTRFRRRTLGSSLLGLAGLLIVGSGLVEEPLFVICYWLTVVALLCWIVAIAAADWITTRQHFQQLRAEYRANTAALRAEIEKYKREQQT